MYLLLLHIISQSVLVLLMHTIVCTPCTLHRILYVCCSVLYATSSLLTVQISPDVTPPAWGSRSQQGHGGGGEVANAGDGEYSKVYETVRQIGEGAFGFVAFSRRREDGLMVSG